MNRLDSDVRSSPRVRTSLTHPLRIDQIDVGGAGGAGGAIGITFCPGKCGPSAQRYIWERDLDADLDVVAAWGPEAVVTLIEDHEFRMLKVPDLGQRIRARGIDWYHLPIVDVSVPDARFETDWREAGPTLKGHLEAGDRVLVHCRGGLGRAGTIAARLLIELGVKGGEAVRRVRAARPGAIETAAQCDYVLRMDR
jgi:ADP-ribosyl-[dinitrogen reductase] hydrolase